MNEQGLTSIYKEYLKPLFRKLKNQQLDENILRSLDKILRYVEQRYYYVNNAFVHETQ